MLKSSSPLLAMASPYLPASSRLPRSFQHFLTPFIAVFLLLIILITAHAGRARIAMFPGGRQTSFQQPELKPDLDLLNTLNTSRSIFYTRREVVLVRSTNPDEFTRVINADLMSGSELINLDNDSHEQQDLVKRDTTSTTPSITIAIPAPPSIKPDASHILFGLATQIDRLNDSLAAFSHWAGNTHCRLVALVSPSSPELLSQVLTKATSMSIDLDIVESPLEYNDAYFSLLQVLHERSDQTTKWVSLIDDDTFFLSMSALTTQLSTYDHKIPAYLGGLSEDLYQMATWGYMAFGGAGIFLSLPLLAQLNQPELFDACNAIKWTGDRRLAQCIYRHTLTKLTIVPGLHQLDLHNDMAGFYEGEGRPQPLSVHHWKSWYHHDMAKVAVIGQLCGDACLLQHWRFSDGWTLVNGFSALKHSPDYDSQDGTAMEATWGEAGGSPEDAFAHSLAPLSPKDEGKVSLKMVEAIDDGNGVIRQFYIRQGTAEEGGQDHVLEVVWRLSRRSCYFC